MAIHVVKEPVPKPGTLGRTELYALAIGQVIGAGVITLIVPAIKMTGYSAWLAYFVAILMGFVMILPFVFISSTLRLGGGNYSMLCDLSSPRTSGIFAYMYLTQCLSLSLFGASAAAYLGDIIPALNSHWARVIVGVTLLTFFYVVNLMGVDIMAKAQKMMTWLLIAALILFAIVGIFKMKLPIFDFSDPNFAINGWGITFNNGQISGGPIMALLSTLNSSFAYNSITIGQSCDDGWLPKSFGKKNKSGARPYILTFMYVVGIIPIVFGLSITTITNMVQLITSAFAILNFTAEIKMPKKYPDAWKQSRYHVPDGLYYTICCVSLALFLVVLWKSLLSMNIGLAVINVVVIVIAGLIGFWRSKTGNIEIHTSVWAEDYQEASES